MPRYVYKTVKQGCSYCADGFEVSHSARTPALEKCPRCQEEIQRVIFAVATVGKESQVATAEQINQPVATIHSCSDHCSHKSSKKKAR